MRTTSDSPGSSRAAEGVRGARNGGFTRADLLGILVTVGLLVIVFIPGLSAAGEGASASGCLNNLRRLTQAWMMFAEEHNERFPINVDGVTTTGGNWVGGWLDLTSTGFGNTQILLDPRYSQLGAYTRDATVYRCPADLYKRIGTRDLPHARSFSMNLAVGTAADGYKPVDGGLLDGLGAHVAGLRWRTYGKLGDLIDPSPSVLQVFLGEDVNSINDGYFVIAMPTGAQARLIDFPSARHNGGGEFAFADGSAGLHVWRDPRTLVTGTIPGMIAVPNSVDQAWLAYHTSVLIK